jgi:hypothetical protein
MMLINHVYMNKLLRLLYLRIMSWIKLHLKVKEIRVRKRILGFRIKFVKYFLRRNIIRLSIGCISKGIKDIKMLFLIFCSGKLGDPNMLRKRTMDIINIMKSLIKEIIKVMRIILVCEIASHRI